MIIRNLDICDAPLMLEWLTDKSINCFFRFDSSDMKLADAENFIEKASKSDNCIHYAVADDDNQYMGTVSLKNIDYTDKNAEIAVSFRKCAHGTPFTVDGMKAVIEKAFTELGLNKIYLNVLADNTRAIKFYEKLGFIYEGTSRKHIFIRDKYCDLKWYAIFNERTDI